MISEKMEKTLNGQINLEMHSAYIYMGMSAHCANIGLKGSSVWFMAQYHEEMLHAMKQYEYLQSQGGEVVLTAIEPPLSGFSSLLDIFEKTLAHEQFMTKNVNALMDLAIEEKDHATQIFMQWYVTEQVEEEDTVNEIVAKLKLIADDKNALLTIDKELGARLVTVPTDFSQGIEAAAKGV